MTSDGSPRPISPLRARMIVDMTVRGFSEKTRHDYVRKVRADLDDHLRAHPMHPRQDQR